MSEIQYTSVPDEEIMDLLETFDAARFQFCQDSAFKESVCFLFALPVNSIVTVKEPVKERG